MIARAPCARAPENAQRAQNEATNILEITARSISSMPQDTARECECKASPPQCRMIESKAHAENHVTKKRFMAGLSL